MATIILVCPMCRNKLHTEEASRYYNDSYGCTITCHECNLSLIGVDLSVCAKCNPSKKSRMNCNIKYCAMVENK